MKTWRNRETGQTDRGILPIGWIAISGHNPV